MAIAKNYLSREEIDALNLIVSAYFDFAELQARSHRPMHMEDWITKLDDFLRLSEQNILTHAGRISHQQAEDHANAQYELYERQRQELDTSEFDEAAKRLTGQPTPPKLRRRKKKADDQTQGGA